MFATAARNFVEEVDPGGPLIPVSSLNDTVALLTVVVKRKRVWFWRKSKYIPTDFNLNDLLTGDTPITPVVIESDFIKYNGTYGDNIQGSVDAQFVHANVNLEGKDTSKLQSSFGSLKKEEVDMQKLLKASKERILDMSHCLIQQTKEKHRRTIGIVKERIVTAQPCSVIEDVQQGGQCGGLLSLCGPTNPKVSLKENGSLGKDSNVTMEIPPHTTIAYTVTELEVKNDGRFNLCVMSDTTGGFEVDGSTKALLCTGEAPAQASNNTLLTQELEKLSHYFQVLSDLPASTKSSLLQQITKVIVDRAAVTSLENMLHQMCLNESPAKGEVKAESHNQDFQALLEALVQSGDAGQSTSALKALHLLVSALDEMTNTGLTLLGMCCSPTVLRTLELLVQHVSGGRELPESNAGLAALTGDVYEKTQYLFASSNMSLKRDGDTLRTEIAHQPGNLPLVLCIAIRGLASLVHTG